MKRTVKPSLFWLNLNLLPNLLREVMNFVQSEAISYRSGLKYTMLIQISGGTFLETKGLVIFPYVSVFTPGTC